MIQDIKDEILSGDPRYAIRDSSGNVLNDNVDISLKTPITQEGTPVNRALFRNLQGDLYTQDRYNELEMHRRMVSVDYETNLVYSEENHIGDCIPKVWTATDSTNLVYVAEDGTKVYASSKDGSYTPDKACDGNEETFWHANTYGSNQHLTIEFVNPIRIKKIKVAARLYSPSWSVDFYIWGSNDNQNWTTLATTSTPLVTNPSLREINIESVVAYKYFRFATEVYGKQTCVIHELQVTEYSTDVVYGKYEYYSNLDIPITSYEEGKIIKCKVGRIPIQETHTDNFFPTDSTISQGSYSDNKYLNENGLSIEVSSPYDSSTVMRWLFPNSYDNEWASGKNTTTAYIMVKMPKPIKMKEFYLNWRVSAGSTAVWTGKLLGSKDGVTWADLVSDLPKGNISIGSPDYYLFYKFEFTGNSSYMLASDFKMVEYTTDYIEEFDNIVLNINNLGDKQMPSCKYRDILELYYKNGKWYLANGIIYGTYTGNDSNNGQNIVLERKPKMVIIAGLYYKNPIILYDGSFLGSNTVSSNSFAYNMGNGYGVITENGFSVVGKSSTTYGFNNLNSKYEYIAIL